MCYDLAMNTEDRAHPLEVTITSQTIIRVILFGLLVLALYELRSLVSVLLASIVIASFVESGVRKFKKIGMGRIISVVLIYILVLAIIVAVFYIFVPIFIIEFSNVLTLISNHFPKVGELLGEGTIQNARQLVASLGQNASIPDIVVRLQAFFLGFSGGFFNAAGSLFSSVFNFVVLLVISFYLSMQDRGIENFLRIITPRKQEEYVIDLWQRTERKIGFWVQGQLLLGLVIGLIIFIGLSILGMKYALLVSIIAAILELIPFGMILAAVPAIAFAFLDGGFYLAVIVAAFYFVVHQLEVYVISPTVVNRVIGVSPLVVILSLLIGAELAGFWGVVLAVPVAVCFLEYISDIEKKKIGQIESRTS